MRESGWRGVGWGVVGFQTNGACDAVCVFLGRRNEVTGDPGEHIKSDGDGWWCTVFSFASQSDGRKWRWNIFKSLALKFDDAGWICMLLTAPLILLAYVAEFVILSIR